MMGIGVAYRENLPAFRKDYGLENALAKHVRRRWPDKAIAYVAHEWSLTESEAAKVVYAGASKAVLNKILHHKRGGFSLFLELLCDATNTRLEDYIREQARRAADERARWEAEERRLAILEARVSGVCGLAGRPDQPPRSDRSDDAPLGSYEDGDAVRRSAKSFRPNGRGGRR